MHVFEGRMAAAVLLVAACGGADPLTDTEASSEDALSANSRRINIGFNGGPDQFDYFADFFGASTIHPGPRICHTYVEWNVGEQTPGMGDASSTWGTRPWLEYWLSRAEGHCDEALITFQAHTRQDAPTGGPHGEFARAFEAFLAQPWAAETGFRGAFAFTPWNEPNNPFGAGNGLGAVLSPERAAEYYLAAAAACARQGCKVAAGDFASNGNWWNDFEWNCADDNVAPRDLCKTKSSMNPTGRPASYLDRYKNYIANHAEEYGLQAGHRPAYFAFHGWHDINEYMHTGDHCRTYGDCATRRILQSLGGSWSGVQIWDTEVGVDQDAAPIPDSQQACGAAFLLRMSSLSARIHRVYYTRLHGGSGELLRGHTPRSALQVLAERRTTAAHCW